MGRPPQDQDIDYELLREIAAQDGASQRDLARRLGVSVGKVNYCLRAVIDRGWVKANNFRRSDNKWAYAYLLTPNGMKAKLHLARAFLERKEQEYLILQNEIAQLRRDIEPKKPGSE